MMQDTTAPQLPKPSVQPVVIWLFVMSVLVGLMVVIGGITRLTESGLSMVEWRPLIGTFPPLSEKEWLRVFTLYQDTPEFRQHNSDMDLAGFKLIFFWEYFHRLWGRMLGLAFFIPLIYFWLKNAIPSGYHLPLIGLLCLGGFQGVVGWWMVTSGLVDNPAVSQYRLASHLSIALIIYGLLIWTGLNMMFGRVAQISGHHIGTILLLGITIIAGAFVAGMDAGLLYNEYPLMGEGLIPVEYGEKGALDMFENPASAQFHHRWIAVLAALAVLTLGYRAIMRGFLKLGWLTIMVVICQFALGLTTLLMGVPVWAGALHQTGAVLLLAAVLVTIHALGRPCLKGLGS